MMFVKREEMGCYSKGNFFSNEGNMSGEIDDISTNTEMLKTNQACYYFTESVEELLKYTNQKPILNNFCVNCNKDGLYILDLDINEKFHSLLLFVLGEKTIIMSMYESHLYTKIHESSSIEGIFNRGLENCYEFFYNLCGIRGLGNKENYELGEKIKSSYVGDTNINSVVVADYFENVVLPYFTGRKEEASLKNKIVLMRYL